MVKLVNNPDHVSVQLLQFGVLAECRIARGLVHEGRLLAAEALSALDQTPACQSGKHVLGHLMRAKESAVLEQDSHQGVFISEESLKESHELVSPPFLLPNLF